MQPVLTFSLGSDLWMIQSYQLFAVLGSASALALSFFFLKREGIRQIPLLQGALLVLFLIGARLWNFGVDPDAYQGAFRLTSFSFKGFSFYGGLLGAGAGTLAFARLTGQDLWRILDALVIPTAVAFAFARIGCFLAGCCGGRITFSSWGMSFPSVKTVETTLGAFSPILMDLAPKLYPTQLYELSLGLLFLIPVIPVYFRPHRIPGLPFLLYGTLFSAMRLMVLPFRAMPYSPVITGLVYPMIYGTLILLGIWAIRKRIFLFQHEDTSLKNSENTLN